jgi:acyl carrier protein
MSTPTVFQSLSAVIVKRFGVDPEAITPESSFEDLDLDSLAQIELVTAVKKTLGLVLSDQEMADMPTIGAVAARLEEIGQQV